MHGDQAREQGQQGYQPNKRVDKGKRYSSINFELDAQSGLILGKLAENKDHQRRHGRCQEPDNEDFRPQGARGRHHRPLRQQAQLQEAGEVVTCELNVSFDKILKLC